MMRWMSTRRNVWPPSSSRSTGLLSLALWTQKHNWVLKPIRKCKYSSKKMVNYILIVWEGQKLTRDCGKNATYCTYRPANYSNVMWQNNYCVMMSYALFTDSWYLMFLIWLFILLFVCYLFQLIQFKYLTWMEIRQNTVLFCYG